MKELKDSDHRSVQRFLGEGEVMFILRHPCILGIIAANLGDKNYTHSLVLSLEPTSLESAIDKNNLDDLNGRGRCMYMHRTFY
ncbi:hypothetical protein M9Y10_017684 [Tritrichomonas musculus]|uniref:Uncharacterized protein n=1 Tax=Tritrichomonas musculus TaxID=1915356 RepID=A0ABR2HU65_9EUKA